MQWPRPQPHRLTLPHQQQDKQERKRANRSLDPEARLRPLGVGPSDLKVTDDEPADGAREVDPR